MSTLHRCLCCLLRYLWQKATSPLQSPADDLDRVVLSPVTPPNRDRWGGGGVRQAGGHGLEWQVPLCWCLSMCFEQVDGDGGTNHSGYDMRQCLLPTNQRGVLPGSKPADTMDSGPLPSRNQTLGLYNLYLMLQQGTCKFFCYYQLSTTSHTS